MINWGLTDLQYFSIGKSDAAYFEKDSLWGDDVKTLMPSALYDVSEAGSCYALARYTATVFHAMRALEFGIEKMGGDLGISLSAGTWGQKLGDIETAINSLPNGAPGSSAKQKKVFYSEYARNFRYVKDALRDRVMHTERQYTETEAHTILNHTGELLCHLAKGYSP